MDLLTPRVHRTARRHVVWVLMAALLLVPVAETAQGQPEGQVAETTVKAAFLYKFCGYVDWPSGAFDSPDSPLRIGVIAADELAGDLSTMVASRTVGARPVAVRVIRRGEPLSGLHVLFIGRSGRDRRNEIDADLKGKAILLVTESDDAVEFGGTINFVVVDNKVRFDIDLRSAEAARLRVSARLLAVARTVIAGPT